MRLQRPNILLVQCDQMTPFLTGAYGHPVVKTPNLDALAREGVRFDAAYSPSPVCGPSRMAAVTGRHASDIGCFDNASALAPDEPTLGHYLTNAGYEAVISGKMHFVGPDQLHGFKRRLNTDIYPSGFWWTPPLGDASRRELDGTLAEPIAKGYGSAGVRQWTTYLDYDEETHFRALEYLRSGRTEVAADGSAPFCLLVSYHHPHQPLHVTPELWDLYEGEEIEIPLIPENVEAKQSIMDEWLNNFHGLNEVDLGDPETLRRMRRAYYALVTYVDRKLGELMRALDDYGLAEDTAVVFMSDHGEMIGERGMIQKRHFYEHSCRVPLVVSLPQRMADGLAGTVCEAPVSLVDLLPTVLGVAGTKEEEALPVDGIDLLAALRAGGVPEERPVFAELHSEGVNAPCYMVRRGRHKYLYFHGHGEQLFDLESDPGEWRDLSDDPRCSGPKEELRRLILERFDPDETTRRIEASKRKRHIVGEAMKRNGTRWDYQPFFDATEQYVRENRE